MRETDYSKLIDKARKKEFEEKEKAAKEFKEKTISTGLQALGIKPNPKRGGSLSGNIGYLGATEQTFTPYIILDTVEKSMNSRDEEYGKAIGFYGYRQFASSDLSPQYNKSWFDFSQKTSCYVEFDTVIINNERNPKFLCREDMEEFISLCKGGVFL